MLVMWDSTQKLSFSLWSKLHLLVIFPIVLFTFTPYIFKVYNYICTYVCVCAHAPRGVCVAIACLPEILTNTSKRAVTVCLSSNPHFLPQCLADGGLPTNT